METRTRKPRAVRREEIVGAVLRIIGTQGIAALTTTRVATEVGVTSGALFRHFETRDEILEETVRAVAERIDATFPDESLPGRERLHRLIVNRIETITAEPGIWWFLHSDQASLTLPPDAVEMLRSRARRSRAFVLEALEDGVADGTIRGDVDPEHLTFMVLGVVHAFLGRAHTKATPGEVAGVADALVRVIAPR